MKSFISKIREKLGHDKFVHPAARILIENEKGEFLFIHRADNGLLGIPAGGLEENETIEECVTREVYEETGLKLKNLTTIGISSNPKTQTVKYISGDVIQYFCIEFYSTAWEGEPIVLDPNEVTKVEFKDKSFLEKLPLNERSIIESYHYYKEYKKVMVK
jgi:8-oxo-dGTP pyrophosphatase MutT (NUDIX family)